MNSRASHFRTQLLCILLLSGTLGWAQTTSFQETYQKMDTYLNTFDSLKLFDLTASTQKRTLAEINEQFSEEEKKISRQEYEKLKADTYRYEAIYYFKAINMAAMDKAIEKILDLYPDYEPKLEDEPYFKTRLKELRTERLKKLSFSVSKKAEEIGMEPAYVVSVSQEEIYQRGYTHLEELFHDLPGFTANTIKGLYYTQLYQRGYRSSNATDRTLIMVNGVEDNSLFSSVAYISRQYPLSNIKKVEVIYGPASTIYGPNAFTGVINIVTKEIYDYFPNEENLHVMADAGYGTYNTRYGDITVAGERNEVWGSATARWFQSDEMDLTNQSVNISGTDLFYWDGLWDEGYAIDSVYTQGLTTDDTAAMAAIAQSDPAGLWHYTQGNTVYPTDTAIARAQELDRMNYGALDPELRAFDNPTNDYFLGATLGYKGFKLSVQHWQRQEGRTATHIDRRLAHASEASELTVQSTLLSAWYQQAITNRLT
ncbi:MAG TPA: hypothetical protein DCP28_30295, partial [Cytophagales bacterium]|nr:hypothetical protein [Cytophagales bacterium]